MPNVFRNRRATRHLLQSLAMAAGVVAVAIHQAESVGQETAATPPTLAPIKLDAPQTDKGTSLMEALKQRRSSRAFSSEKLSHRHLSEVLWAADGVNREDGHRTAPSALGRNSVDVYAVLEEGIYRYDAAANELQPVAAGDHRKTAGTQDFVWNAPLNLVYVADLSRTADVKASIEDKMGMCFVEAGCQSQNVYLYCASEGISTVVRASIDREAFAKAAGLSDDHRVLLAQTVGYPE